MTTSVESPSSSANGAVDSGEEWMEIKVDASAEGCSGMYWRIKPVMSATGGGSDWPRNGTILRGRLVTTHAGWIQFDNGFWLPQAQNNVTVCHIIAKHANQTPLQNKKTGFFSKK